MKRRVSRHEVVQPLDQSYRLIPLTRNQNAIVDATDFEWLSRWNWFARWSENTHSFYASRDGGHTDIRMHNVILNCGPHGGDHVNNNTLDNRRENLRKCTQTQNACNRRPFKGKRYKGVKPYRTKWIARIGSSGKIYLGSFVSAEEAARAYDTAARELHGEFANLNFPES